MSSGQSGLHGKTEIAAWWLTAVGIITAILGVVLVLLNPASGYHHRPIAAPVAYAIFILSLSLPGMLNIIAGIMLLKRKPRARKLSMVLLSIECILFVVAAVATAICDSPAIAAPLILALVLYLIPLILLILDRGKSKNG